jgi:integration host factor subunit alpha
MAAPPTSEPAPATLTRAALADRLQHKLRLSRADAEAMVAEVVAVWSDALVDGEAVRLSGFGSFTVHEKGARPVRNLHSGEAMALPPRRAIRFRPSDGFRLALNPHRP